MCTQIIRIGIAADQEGFFLEAPLEDSLITSGYEVGKF